jgi:mRNA interferase MazF
MMKRGEIYWAALPDAVGSGPGKRRPIVIVQSDDFNKSNISTVIIAVVTSNLALASAPGNVRLPRSETGLIKVSVVNVSQLLTIDRALLISRIGKLSGGLMAKVDLGLSQVLGISSFT